MQHEIVQYIKREQHEKKYNMKKITTQKMQQGNGAILIKVQRENSAA